MAKFESDLVALNTDCQTVFDFLGDFRNFQTLLPPQVKNWQADESSCKFTIEGMADFSMRIDGKYPHSNIHIVSYGKNPADFTLDYYFTAAHDKGCRFSVVFDVKLNPFQKMLASGALQNFVNMLAEKLRERYA